MCGGCEPWRSRGVTQSAQDSVVSRAWACLGKTLDRVRCRGALTPAPAELVDFSFARGKRRRARPARQQGGVWLKNGPGLSPRCSLSSNLGLLFFCLKSALLKYRAGRHYMLTCVTTYTHAVVAAFAAYLPISGHMICCKSATLWDSYVIRCNSVELWDSRWFVSIMLCFGQLRISAVCVVNPGRLGQSVRAKGTLCKCAIMHTSISPACSPTSVRRS